MNRMNRTMGIAAASFGAAVLFAVAPARADFAGVCWDTYLYQQGDQLFWVNDLYVRFDVDQNFMTAMSDFTAEVTPGNSFFHFDAADGSWSPALVPTGIGAPFDSFVTVGAPGPLNDWTVAGAGWGRDGFDQPALPLLAGWFNVDEANGAGQGQSLPIPQCGDGFYAPIGRFTILNPNGGLVAIDAMGAVSFTVGLMGETQIVPFESSVTVYLGPPLCHADLNHDGLVDGSDLGELLGAWGPCDFCAADLDGNQVVDGADLGVLLAAWGPCMN
ncbi:MAG: hypothetical protein KDA22_04710 [Phycisphaerales bacterium]|nr:hypothetical protein [Phycisphaerales bacterium]